MDQVTAERVAWLRAHLDAEVDMASKLKARLVAPDDHPDIPGQSFWPTPRVRFAMRDYEDDIAIPQGEMRVDAHVSGRGRQVARFAEDMGADRQPKPVAGEQRAIESTERP